MVILKGPYYCLKEPYTYPKEPYARAEDPHARSEDMCTGTFEAGARWTNHRSYALKDRLCLAGVGLQRGEDLRPFPRVQSRSRWLAII